MEVTLCLTMLQPAPKKTHCLLPGIKPTSIRRRHQNHSLGFVARTATSSPFLNCGLRAALDSRRVGLSIRACKSTPSSDGDNESLPDNKHLVKLFEDAKKVLQERYPFPMKINITISPESLKQQEEKEMGSHHQYELGLSLVKALIDLKAFDLARQACNAFEDPALQADARPQLLKCVIELGKISAIPFPGP